MSQNKTIFPGIEPEGGNSRRYQNSSREFQQNTASKPGTVFPGMNQGKAPRSYQNPKRNFDKPLIGFLYSISRTGFGEYWPLHIGPNTIGRSPKNDIVLSEGTVSEEHATIVIRMMKNPQKLDASISDKTSSHGTMVNGESIPSTISLECKNGDIITVGETYELYLILIDAQQLGLSTAQDFIEAQTENDSFNDMGEYDGRNANIDDFPPHFYQNPTRPTRNTVAPNNYGDQTVGINGGSNFQSGGTTGMDSPFNGDNGMPNTNKGTEW